MAAAVVCSATIGFSAVERPNIIYIMADDQRADTLGCSGNPVLKTPNIDSLAARGIRFVNAFATSPICCVSRVTVLTGQYARRNGVNDFFTQIQDLGKTYPMMMLINTDRSKETGWEGYDFVLNREAPGVVEKSSNGWNWSKVANVNFTVRGSEMEITIPRSSLDLPDGQPLDIEFKWVDNLNRPDDIMDFHTCGDAAPSGRFNYRYHE